MSTAITPTTPAPIPSATTGPADGDLANAASVNVAFQELLDGAYATRLALYGQRTNVRVQSTHGATLVVSGLGGIALTSGGEWITFSNTGGATVDAATALGSALSASTRYYLYAYNSAGSVAYIAGTTGPDGTFSYLTGNTDYVFVTTFVTDSAATILPYVQTGRTYRYTTPTNDALKFSLGSASAYTTVTLTLALPPNCHSSLLNVFALNSDTTAGGDEIFLRCQGITATGFTGQAMSFANVGTVAGSVTSLTTQIALCVDASLRIQYRWTTGGVGRSGFVWVAGFDL